MAPMYLSYLRNPFFNFLETVTYSAINLGLNVCEHDLKVRTYIYPVISVDK